MQFLKSIWVAATVVSLANALPQGTAAYEAAPLLSEHPGDVFVTSGVPVGVNVTINGINTYVSYPPGKKGRTGLRSIVYLSDIFGNSLINNFLLADNFARAGYVVLFPDLFDGEPIKLEEFATIDFNAWRLRHPPARVDAITESTIAALRGSQFASTSVASVGYCFGGRVVTRFLAEGKGIDVGFAAHPSGVEQAEWEGIRAPLSIAYGTLDAANPPAARANSEAVLSSAAVVFQTSLYSNGEHGFAVRTNLTVPEKKFAQQAAFFQAVSFFNNYL